MNLPTADTIVTFPAGRLTETATVIHVAELPTGLVVLTDRTPFHPLDHAWPDQGADRGSIITTEGRRITTEGRRITTEGRRITTEGRRITTEGRRITTGEGRLPVIDCVVAASDGDRLHVGPDVPVRRGTPGWTFVVAHLIDHTAERPQAGEQVTLEVDPEVRTALSAGHTGCHLAALALNEAVAGYWRKPVPTDGLGRPDFDQLALVSSRIVPNGAVDRYRLGKSLRKQGCDTAALLVDLPDITTRAQAALDRWVAAGASIHIEAVGPRLTDLRTWVCELPEGTQTIPCGGTHLTDLQAVQRIEVDLRAETDTELTMTTTVDY